MRASRLVILAPADVSPRILVISEPAKVVGRHSWGQSVRKASALPRPMAEPPPKATTPSALSAAYTSTVRSVISTGVCMRAPSQCGQPCCRASLAPSADCCLPVITSGRRIPRPSASTFTLSRLPRPKMTFVGSALKMKDCIMSDIQAIRARHSHSIVLTW